MSLQPVDRLRLRALKTLPGWDELLKAIKERYPNHDTQAQYALVDLWVTKAWENPSAVPGGLWFVCRDYQRSLYASLRQQITDQLYVKKDKDALSCVNCCRRFGKTSVIALSLTELCLTGLSEGDHAGRPVLMRWITAEVKNLELMVRPALDQILTTCPEHLRPKFEARTNRLVWPNGSEASLHGLDRNKPRSLRGLEGHIFFLDECGFLKSDDLQDLHLNVVSPVTNESGGLTIICSTPPDTPKHHYVKMQNIARSQKRYEHRDITQMGKTPEEIEAIKESCGGEDSVTYQREYLGRNKARAGKTVVPAWQTHGHLLTYGTPGDEPQKYRPSDDRIVEYGMPWLAALDFGFRHGNGCIWGYFDPTANDGRGRISIERELHIRGVTTQDFCEKLQTIESGLYGSYPGPLGWRVGDSANPQSLHDLAVGFPTAGVKGYLVQPVGKTYLTAMVDAVETLVNAGMLRVHASCEHLLDALYNAIWTNTTSERTAKIAETAEGHRDCLAALIYMAHRFDALELGYELDRPRDADGPGVPPTLRKRESDGWDDVNGLMRGRRSARLGGAPRGRF